jgi:hypothetical protein
MKFSLLSKVLLVIAIIPFFSCTKQSNPTSEDVSESPDSVSIAISTIEIEPSGATNVTFTFSPWKSTWKVNDVTLAYKGSSSAHCHLKEYADGGNGTFTACIVDNGNNVNYSDDFILNATVNDLKYSSKAFAVKCSNVHKSALPIVRITTSAKVADRETWVDAKIAIDGQKDYSDLDTTAFKIKGRGNSTWFYAKKPYALKFDSKTAILGMPKQKRWCLIANYCDRTLLRNAVANYISEHSNLAWTPRSRFVELYLNGKYEGTYQFMEQIRVDKNRVNIHEMSKNDNDGEALTGGYLLELDSYYDEVNKFKSSYSQMPVNIKYPDSDDITTTQVNYIQSYFNDADNLLFSAGFANAKSGWSTKFDMASFADYWLVNELMNNLELKFPKSFYMYKPKNGKLTAGPVWDFDCGSLIKSDQTIWNVSRKCLWISRMLYDPTFNQLARNRWKAMYPFLTTVPDYIRAQAAYIKTSANNNVTRWPKIKSDFANGDESLSWEDAVNLLIEVYQARLEWLNTQITSGEIPTFE